MSPRHALILAINTSILVVLFSLTFWLYRAERRGVESQVGVSLDRAAKMTDQLARLREAELSGLAETLMTTPQLRGALATGDRETIQDVLRALAAKNGLAAVGIVDGAGRLAYANARFRDAAELAAGRLSGSESETGRRLVIAQPPTRELLTVWSSIVGVRLAVAGPGLSVDDLDGVAPADCYRRKISLLDGRLQAELFAPREPFWTAFKSKRDSLIVLGAALFFLGLLMSVLFAALIERMSGESRTEDWRRLVAEIEAARR